MRTDSLLLRLTAFLGMFFASSTVIVDGGGAGGDDGGAGGGGDDGSGADGVGAPDGGGDSDDQGEDGTPDDEAEPEGEEADDLEDDDEELDDEGEDGQARSRDQKKNEAAIKSALNKLRESNPEAASLLRKTFYQQQQQISGYRQIFPTTVAAREAFDLLETHGGEQGIVKNKRDADSFASELNAIAQGDPAIIDDLARDYPQGLEKLTPHIVDRFRQVATDETYDRFAAGIMAPYLKDRGVIDGIRRAAELIGDGKQEDGYKKLVELFNWAQGVSALAQKKAETRDAGRNTELDRREQELNTRQENEYRASVGQVITRRMNTLIQKHLAPFLSGALQAKRGLTAEQKKDLAQGIFTRLSRVLERDDAYQDRFKELLGTKDLSRIDRYAASQLGLKIRKAVRSEWHSRGFATGNATRRATDKRGDGVRDKGAAGGGNRITLGQKPQASQIDWSKDKSRMRYTGRTVNGVHMGEATLRDGKVVRWDWNKV